MAVILTPDWPGSCLRGHVVVGFQNMLQGDVFMTEVTEVDGGQGDVPV